MKSSSDIRTSNLIFLPSVFVLLLRGVMSGRALIYAPYSQFSGKGKKGKKRKGGKKGGEASEARDLGS